LLDPVLGEGLREIAAWRALGLRFCKGIYVAELGVHDRSGATHSRISDLAAALTRDGLAVRSAPLGSEKNLLIVLNQTIKMNNIPLGRIMEEDQINLNM
jgi:hypothetical protein